MRLTCWAAFSASSVGGSRNTSFALVSGLRVFPALVISGAPESPTVARLVRQVLLIMSSLMSEEIRRNMYAVCFVSTVERLTSKIVLHFAVLGNVCK